jgi:hypothetical protein
LSPANRSASRGSHLLWSMVEEREELPWRSAPPEITQISGSLRARTPGVRGVLLRPLLACRYTAHRKGRPNHLDLYASSPMASLTPPASTSERRARRTFRRPCSARVRSTRLRTRPGSRSILSTFRNLSVRCDVHPDIKSADGTEGINVRALSQ